MSVVVAVLTGALLLAAPASAAPVLHALELKGSNGYKGFALAGETGPGEGMISIYLTAASSGVLSAVDYTAPATVTSKTIEADLGALGRFSLELVPTGKTRSVPVGCGKEREWQQVEDARYKGAVEFHGEEDFTEISTARVPVAYALVGRLACADTTTETRPPRWRNARLEVDRYEGKTHVLEVNIAKDRPGGDSAAARPVLRDGHLPPQRPSRQSLDREPDHRPARPLGGPADRSGPRLHPFPSVR